MSRVGNDALGQEALDRLCDRRLPPETIQRDASAPTGTAGVEVGADGQPQFTIHQNVAWDRLEAEPAALAAVSSADAICFGTLGQRSVAARRAIQVLVSAAPTSALRLFDINLRAPFWSPPVIEWSLDAANALKLNDHELPVLAEMFGLRGAIRDQIAQLADQFQLRLVGLTRGAHGSLLYTAGQWSEQQGRSVTVRDAVGAGDAFAATLTIGWLQGRSLDEINRLANDVAAYVCTQPGATPLLPAHLRAAVDGSGSG